MGSRMSRGNAVKEDYWKGTLTSTRSKSIDECNEHDTSSVLHSDECNRQRTTNGSSDDHLVVHTQAMGELIRKHSPNEVRRVHDGNLAKRKHENSVHEL